MRRFRKPGMGIRIQHISHMQRTVIRLTVSYVIPMAPFIRSIAAKAPEIHTPHKHPAVGFPAGSDYLL